MSDISNFLSDTWNSITEKTGEAISKAEEGAKESIGNSISNWIERVGNKAFEQPTIQDKVKKASGQKIGVWIIDNWKLLAGVTAGVILLAIATRKKW